MRWACVLVPVLLGLGIAFLALTGGRQGWVFVNGAFVLVFCWLCVLPHELAHACAAWALGLRVHGVVVGSGPLLAHGTFGHVPFQWRTYPFRGATYVQIIRHHSYAWRRFLMVAAGPASHVLMLWAAISLAPERAFAPGIDDGPSPWVAFVIANVLMLIGNMWPHMDPATGVRTDGKQMLDFILRRHAVTDDFTGSSAVTEVMLLCEARQWRAADEVICQSLRNHRDDAFLRMMRTATLSQTGRAREAAGHARRMLSEGPDTELIKAFLFNNAAWALCLLGDERHAAEAMKYAGLAIDALEWSAPVVATHGLVHALFGDVEIARKVFDDDRLRRQLKSNAATWTCSRAILQTRLGHIGVARECIRTAVSIDPTEPLLVTARAFIQHQERPVVGPSLCRPPAHEGSCSSLLA